MWRIYTTLLICKRIEPEPLTQERTVVFVFKDLLKSSFGENLWRLSGFMHYSSGPPVRPDGPEHHHVLQRHDAGRVVLEERERKEEKKKKKINRNHAIK